MYSDNTNLSICNMTTLKKKKILPSKKSPKRDQMMFGNEMSQIKVNQA